MRSTDFWASAAISSSTACRASGLRMRRAPSRRRPRRWASRSEAPSSSVWRSAKEVDIPDSGSHPPRTSGERISARSGAHPYHFGHAPLPCPAPPPHRGAAHGARGARGGAVRAGPDGFGRARRAGGASAGEEGVGAPPSRTARPRRAASRVARTRTPTPRRRSGPAPPTTRPQSWRTASPPARCAACTRPTATRRCAGPRSARPPPSNSRCSGSRRRSRLTRPPSPFRLFSYAIAVRTRSSACPRTRSPARTASRAGLPRSPPPSPASRS